MIRILIALCLVFGATPAFSQAVNINFGVPGNGPSDTYAAAGLAGTWNTLEAMAGGVRFPLVGLDGSPLVVDIRQIGGDFIMSSDDPGTSGDDERLVDDVYWTFQSPPDMCFWIDNLENGDYTVIIYAITPNDPNLISEVRVDNPPDAATVGGAWPGTHAAGITYHVFQQTVTGGEIGLHGGLPGDDVPSAINGIQVIPAAAAIGLADPIAPIVTTLTRAFPNPARFRQAIELDVATSLTGGTLDIVDVQGRIVWTRSLAGLAPGVRQISWDGTDQSGRTLGASVYFVRLSDDAALEVNTQLKLIRID